jgi:hypothetical protein
LLDANEHWQTRLGKQQAVVCSDEVALRHAIERAPSESTWISSGSDRTEELVRSAAKYVADHRGGHRRFRDLLLLESPKRFQIIPVLHGWFHRVVGEVPQFKMLPTEQLAEVLSLPLPERRDLCIGGVVDELNGTLALTRGDFETITVPLSIFRPSGNAAPKFRSLAVDDYGQTIRFGSYEATVDVVLYELDSDYRRRVNMRRRQEEQSFGAALRRLRTQRGLSREDFSGLSAKTIARIERDEVEAPHGRTLTILAKRLGVSPQEIATY